MGFWEGLVLFYGIYRFWKYVVFFLILGAVILLTVGIHPLATVGMFGLVVVILSGYCVSIILDKNLTRKQKWDKLLGR